MHLFKSMVLESEFSKTPSNHNTKKIIVDQIVSAMETNRDCLALNLFYKSLKQMGIADPKQLVEELSDYLEQAQMLSNFLRLELPFPSDCLVLKNSLPTALELAKAPTSKQLVLAIDYSLKTAIQLCEFLKEVIRPQHHGLTQSGSNDLLMQLSMQLVDSVGQATAYSLSLKPTDHDEKTSLENSQTLGFN